MLRQSVYTAEVNNLQNSYQVYSVSSHSLQPLNFPCICTILWMYVFFICLLVYSETQHMTEFCFSLIGCRDKSVVLKTQQQSLISSHIKICVCHTDLDNKVYENYLTFQFQGYAYDLGLPNSLNTSRLADIFITVIRNNFPPRFVNEPYNVTIQETHPALSSVFQTTAIDQDTQVRNLSLGSVRRLDMCNNIVTR